MEPVTLAVVSLAVLMLLLSFGVPIVFCFSGALAFMSIVGGVTMKGMMMWGLQQILSPTLLCIPLFIYAGSLMSESGIAKYLLEFVDVFVGRIRGGLGFVATLTCAILGAISGSTFTGLAATGNMLIPEMVSRGYPRAFATALITCSSILGVLIPPSTPMIIFGWVTGTNVLACFLSTVGPGIVTIIIFCGINFVLSRRFDLKLMPQLSKTEKRRQIAVRGWKALPALIMPVLILGGIYSGAMTPTEAAAALSKARQELTALLAASGRPADALEPKFTCKLCQDTGSVQGRTCTCVHKLMQGLRREGIEALSSLSLSSFDTMELRYYPNTMDEKLGEPVRTYMGGLLEDLRSYAEEFDHNSESLMLFGNAGLGKTHAALAIAGIVLQKDFDVIYVSSPDFFGKLENARFDSSEDAETLLRTASAADLLILDDLGTEFVTPYFITTFYSLLNNRLGAGLPTIVTTNIADGSLLEKRYTEKISSRLSSFVPCLFAGEDIRGLKAAE